MDDAERPPQIINHHDLMRASGVWRVAWWPKAHSGWKRSMVKDADTVLKCWDDVLAAHPTVTEWATIGGKGYGPWFPADRIPAVQALKLTSDYLGKIGNSVRCPIGRPCEAVVNTGDSRLSSWAICSRPAVEPPVFVSEMGSREVRACKMHVAAQKRRDDNMARWRAEWDERDRKRDHASAMDQASREWAERLVAELGVKAEAHHHRGDAEGLRVLVEPERLYRQVVSLLDELRGLGLDELSTFVPGEVER